MSDSVIKPNAVYLKWSDELKKLLLKDNITRLMIYDDDGEHVEYKRVGAGKTTNADRIRAMTDEELADKIAAMIKMDCLNCVVLQNDCMAWESKAVDCKDAWLNWLKQEVDE